ncbi:MAG: hypothetical protein DME26_15050 [Verrucomicrobia bacterium]|nr:MAG: hypothetical protein DME26_15050 [Verrucomicrobiota bacterium]
MRQKRFIRCHGFAADFAQTLRELGFNAQALSENEQMALSLDAFGGPPSGGHARESAQPRTVSVPRPHESETPNNVFLRFAETGAAIGATRSKLEKVRLLAEYLRTLRSEETAQAVTWFTGLPFPLTENKALHVGWALLRDALCAVGNIDEPAFRQVYLKHSDLGEAAFEVWRQLASQTAGLSLDGVDSLFQQVHAARGPLRKLPLLIAALRRCSPLEAKFLVKIITSDLRIGLKEGLVEDAIALGFNVPAEEVRQVNLLLGNISETAVLAQKGQLRSASLLPFRPVKFMLASPEATAQDIWERIVCRRQSVGGKPGDALANSTRSANASRFTRVI